MLEEIARGGMGIVYRARQVSLNRLVAVKVLLAGDFAGASFLKRFRREAEATASLNHPNIVGVHEVGDHEGRPYFSMELVEGRDLAELVRDQPLSATMAAQLLKTVAEAVHFAHERGLLHRDLKPANVLVDRSNVPHITDFGLAKRTVAAEVRPASESGIQDRPSPTEQPAHDSAVADDLTLTGQVLGTPNYMPPEQADPARGPTTAASDVYSLGAILYQLLTGRAPFMAATLTQTLRLVTETEAVSPRLLSPNVPRDLETICLKCLEKDPRRRYATARELADELERFLNDEPIRARPVARTEKLIRWCRRRPALAAAIATGALLLLVIAIGSPVAIIRINDARQAAEGARENAEKSRQQELGLRVRAEAAERATERQLYTALLEQARATILSGEMGQRLRALDAVHRAGAISNSSTLRGLAVSALDLPDLRFERDVPVMPGVLFPELDRDFKRIAFPRGTNATEIWSVDERRLLASLPASTNLPAIGARWSPDGRFLMVTRDHDSAGRIRDLEVWDVAVARQGLLLRSLWTAFHFHPHRPQLLVGRLPADASIWDLERGREIARHRLGGEPRDLRFAPNGESFAVAHSVGGEWMVAVHHAASGALGATRVFGDQVNEIAWHPGGRWLAVADASGTVHWMDAQTGITRIFGRHRASAVRVIFSPDGEYLFSGGWDRDLICWDVNAMQRAFSVGLDSYEMQVCADGRQCAIYRWPDPHVRLHTLERPALYRELAGNLGGGRNHAAFSPDGRWMAASGDGRLVVWDLSSDDPGVESDEAGRSRLRFAPNGDLFVDQRGRCFRFRVKPGTNRVVELEPLALASPSGFVSLCLVSNGVVLSGSSGSRLAAFDQLAEDTGGWKSTVDGLNGASPDGRWLGMYRSFTPHLYVHRLPGFERVAKLTNDGNISRFEFSPLNDEVAVSSRAGGILFWSTTTWQRTRHLTNVTDLRYSPDGRTFWLSTARTTALHDALTLEPLLPLPGGTLPLAFSPDGRYLAASVNSGRMRLWDLAGLRKQLRAIGLDWATD